MSIDNSTSSADAVLERTNAREIDETVIRSSPDLVVCDASFIPLHKVCLCVYMYIYLYLYLCVCVCVSICLAIHPSIYLSVYLSTRTPTRMHEKMRKRARARVSKCTHALTGAPGKSVAMPHTSNLVSTH
jgi:hypothetical protein